MFDYIPFPVYCNDDVDIIKFPFFYCHLKVWENIEVIQHKMWCVGRVWNDCCFVFSQKLSRRQRRVKRSCHDGEIDPQIPLLRLFFLWTDPNEICNKLATSKIVIILFPRTNSFTLFTFLSPSVPHLIRGHTAFELGKPLENLHSFHFVPFISYFQQFRTFSNIFPQFKVKLLYRHAVV